MTAGVGEFGGLRLVRPWRADATAGKGRNDIGFGPFRPNMGPAAAGRQLGHVAQRTLARRGADKWHVRVPNGENYAEVAARASDWVSELKADTFAVSHGALTRILRGLFAGLDWQQMSGLDEPQGVVFRIRGSEVVRLDR